MADYIHEVHFDFSGGVNQYAGSLLKADNELDKLENGELANFGPITKAKGSAQRGDDVNTDYNILGLCSAFKSDGTRKQIAVANGAASSDAYTYNPINGAWTAHGLSLTTGAKAEFEYFLDGWFMVNFSDATRFNNFTQWYTTTNVTNASKARYIKQYMSRLYLAYCVDGSSTFTSRICFSDLPSGDPLTIAWDNSVNYFDVDPDDGDVIKGLEVNSNRLLIFKENSLHRYDTNTRYKVPGCPGTVSQRSVANLQGLTLYLHSTGIYAYNGETSKLVSRPIKDIINGISTANLTNASAIVKGDHYYLYLGDINNPTTGLTISNCLVDYDVSKNAFAWRSLQKDPLCWTLYRDDRSNVLYDATTVTYNGAETTYNGLVSSEEQIYYGTVDGIVCQFDTGNQDNEINISMSFETKDFYLGNPSIFKLLQRMVVYADSGRQVTLQYRMDDGNWKTLGRLSNTITELVFPAASRCRKVKFRVLESSGGSQFSFEGFDIYFSPEATLFE